MSKKPIRGFRASLPMLDGFAFICDGCVIKRMRMIEARKSPEEMEEDRKGSENRGRLGRKRKQLARESGEDLRQIRRQNMAKAREARMRKLRERKAA